LSVASFKQIAMCKACIAFCLFLAVLIVAGCASGPVPANYYENDIHHGYPGPGVSDPSAT
jgi:hypothetical protein